MAAELDLPLAALRAANLLFQSPEVRFWRTFVQKFELIFELARKQALLILRMLIVGSLAASPHLRFSKSRLERPAKFPLYRDFERD